MSACVNLIPASCLLVRRRSARRNRWAGVVLSSMLVVLCGGALRFTASAAEQQEANRLAFVQARQADLDRHLSTLAKTRASLLERARDLARLRQRCETPVQLVALAADMPDGVYLTELRAAPVPLADPSIAAKPTAPSGGPNPRPATPAAPARPAEGGRTIQISGVAVDHATLAQFIESVRGVPGWEQVELLRASRELSEGRATVAFRIECRERRPEP